MASIQAIHGREIIDSRGLPTVEVEILVEGIGKVRASVPSGKSTGTHEAVELRDKDPSRFSGKGVLKAVQNVNETLHTHLLRMDTTLQYDIDSAMINLDGTSNKANLGANAILGVSLAVARAAAQFHAVPLYKYLGSLASNHAYILPVPAFNILNGGSHAGNNLAIQEIMIIPIGATNFQHALRMGCEIYALLRGLLITKYGLHSISVGDEGGFAPPFETIYEALDILIQAIEQSGYRESVRIGLDVAASEFFDASRQVYNLDYKLPLSEQRVEHCKSGEEMIDMYNDLVKSYPIFSIEDPFAEDDWQHFVLFTKQQHQQHGIYVIGDDLLVTNIHRIIQAREQGACNGLLCKMNQIGTLSETLQAIQSAREAHWLIMASHRSGETEDDFLADLAVGFQLPFLKSGAPCRSERLVKYNRLLRIEEELGNQAQYAGKHYSTTTSF